MLEWGGRQLSERGVVSPVDDQCKTGAMMRELVFAISTRPAKATWRRTSVGEMVCRLICKLMGKRDDGGDGSFGSRTTAAVDGR
jgi:hypothetical protein